MTYHIGQVFPPAQKPAEPFGHDRKVAWHCFVPKPTAADHAAGREFFRAHGMFAFYPSEERTRSIKGPRKRLTTEVPIVTGYLFAQCLRQPIWHVIKAEKWCVDVFRIGEHVVEFPYAVIRHLQGLTVDAERLRRAEDELRQQMLEAARPQAGKPARFVAGPFAGEVVTVETVTGQVAYFELMGKRIAADVASLRRVDPTT